MTERLSKREKDDDKLDLGKALKGCLPVMGTLRIFRTNLPTLFIDHVIVPKDGISKDGYVNEIWVPGKVSEVCIDDMGPPFLGVGWLHERAPIHSTNSVVEVYKHNDERLLQQLVLSPRKLIISPYLRPRAVNNDFQSYLL